MLDILFLYNREIMRLDKYLKNSRIIKRRTVAKQYCDAGKILVNDKPQKSSYEVKCGDIITFPRGSAEMRVRVIDILDTQEKSAAKDMYEIIE